MSEVIMKVSDFYASYGDNDVVKNINMEFYKNSATAIIGPSGCGKTTFLRTINRMHELSTPTASTRGQIYLDDKDIYKTNPILVRRKIGMVFQRPNPFPTMTIYDNVISGYLLNGIKLNKSEKDSIVEKSLKDAGLWEEVKDLLHRKGTFLSGGQQQRLCIARALAMEPEILLLDEATSALDPKSTAQIEDLIMELKEKITIIMVTHNIGQAGRISDYTAFFYLGDLVEYSHTDKMFMKPEKKQTEDYLIGKFG